MNSFPVDNVKPFDFRKPCRLPLPVEKRLTHWQQRACRLLPQKWTGLLEGDTSWTISSPETVMTSDATLPEFTVVYQVAIAGAEAPTLLAMPSQLSAAIVAATLGQSDVVIAEPRGLTTVELSMLELAFQATIDAIAESGAGAGYPDCSLGSLERRALLIRLYPSEPELVFMRFRVKFPFGEGNIDWIWPASLADQMFEPTDDESARATLPAELGDVAMRIPLSLTVELGSVELHVADLGNLQAGDVLILDQRICDPLPCFVEDHKLFDAFPGVTGNKQSIRVTR